MNPKKTSQAPPLLGEALSQMVDVCQTPKSRELAALSDLDAAELRQFAAAWTGLSAEHKHQVLHRLMEISENNVEYNFNAVYKYVLSDPDMEVRRLAVACLWEDEEPSLVRPLLRLLAEDSAAAVREAAAMALGRFSLLAEWQKINPEYRHRLSQALLEVIADSKEDINVRRRALEAVAPISVAEVTQAIWAAYRQDDPRLKASAIYAMGKNCDLLWLPTIIKELGNEDAELRYEAVTAAGELGEMEAVPLLVELLSDEDTEVKLAAVLALGKIGGAEAKRTLRACLGNKSQAIREAAEQALSEQAPFTRPFPAPGLDL
jgi:HEAT repeat protein